MNNTACVSVIVPVYNMQSLLSRCINSILNQTYTNIQLILVDDGSKDDSPRICDEYAASDKRVTALHKENSGVADATNMGLDHVMGDYIIFVDSDDYIAEDMIEKLILARNDSGADIVQAGMTRVNERDEVTEISEHPESIIFGTENILRAFFLENDVLPCLACKLFKKSLFDDYRFESGRNIIDILATPFLLQKCNTYQIISGAPYHAYFRMDSVSRGLMTDKSYDDTLYYLKKWKDFIETNYCSREEFIIRLKYRSCYEMSTRYAIVKKSPGISNKKNKLAYMKIKFKEDFKVLRESEFYNNYPKRRRFMFKLFSISPFLMKAISVLNSLVKRG